MYSKVEWVTPEKASKFLEKNIENNRKVKAKTVAKYAEDMAAGNWQITSQGITFNEDGQLTDGQHRLHAVIKANVAVPMYVTYGEPRNASIHDRGKIRSLSDNFYMKNSTVASADIFAAANSMFNFGSSNGLHVNNPLPEGVVSAFVEGHYDLLNTAVRCTRKGSAHPMAKKASCIAAAACWLFQEYPVDVIERFFEIVNSGFYDGDRESAAIVARMYLSGGWKKEFNSWSFSARRREFDVVCLAFHDFLIGSPRKRAYPSKSVSPDMGVINFLVQQF